MKLDSKISVISEYYKELSKLLSLSIQVSRMNSMFIESSQILFKIIVLLGNWLVTEDSEIYRFVRNRINLEKLNMFQNILSYYRQVPLIESSLNSQKVRSRITNFLEFTNDLSFMDFNTISAKTCCDFHQPYFQRQRKSLLDLVENLYLKLHRSLLRKKEIEHEKINQKNEQALKATYGLDALVDPPKRFIGRFIEEEKNGLALAEANEDFNLERKWFEMNKKVNFHLAELSKNSCKDVDELLYELTSINQTAFLFSEQEMSSLYEVAAGSLETKVENQLLIDCVVKIGFIYSFVVVKAQLPMGLTWKNYKEKMTELCETELNLVDSVDENQIFVQVENGLVLLKTYIESIRANDLYESLTGLVLKVDDEITRIRTLAKRCYYEKDLKTLFDLLVIYSDTALLLDILVAGNQLLDELTIPKFAQIQTFGETPQWIMSGLALIIWINEVNVKNKQGFEEVEQLSLYCKLLTAKYRLPLGFSFVDSALWKLYLICKKFLDCSCICLENSLQIALHIVKSGPEKGYIEQTRKFIFLLGRVQRSRKYGNVPVLGSKLLTLLAETNESNANIIGRNKVYQDKQYPSRFFIEQGIQVSMEAIKICRDRQHADCVVKFAKFITYVFSRYPDDHRILLTELDLLTYYNKIKKDCASVTYYWLECIKALIEKRNNADVTKLRSIHQLQLVAQIQLVYELNLSYLASSLQLVELLLLFSLQKHERLCEAHFVKGEVKFRLLCLELYDQFDFNEFDECTETNIQELEDEADIYRGELLEQVLELFLALLQSFKGSELFHVLFLVQSVQQNSKLFYLSMNYINKHLVLDSDQVEDFWMCLAGLHLIAGELVQLSKQELKIFKNEIESAREALEAKMEERSLQPESRGELDRSLDQLIQCTHQSLKLL
eukprot:snap_masked-scaffold_6-processed-gene-19.3-mRNA-1 protein AED:1.00 eAED:1.00 QI:0/0/0/0/1/1/3/0/894